MIEKLHCRRCKRFIGLVKDDGTGPWLDECQNGYPAHRCFGMAATAQYRPQAAVENVKLFELEAEWLRVNGGSKSPVPEVD